MVFIKPEGDLGIDISLRNSDLNIVFEDRDDVEVSFEELRKNAAEERFIVQLENNRLSIQEKKTKGWMKNFQRENSDIENITVKIPSFTKTEGTIVSYGGDVGTENMIFKGKFQVYSGDIDLRGKTEAEADFKTYSGDLSCEFYSGSLRLHAYSGDVHLKDSDLSFVEIKSYSGDVDITGLFSLEKNSEIKTLSGDTSLKIKGYNGDKTLSVKSLSGDLKVEGEYPEGKVLTSKLSENFADLGIFHFPKFRKIFSNFDSFPGRKEREIKIDENSSNIEKILEMVSQGKLDADSAEKLIKAIRN
ncbi:DUF4097 family beta strand repeat protein [candidate division WOR-3 bacterium]|nr:DUF4097 family beta strand repeat protein [candidate division WOR-3 bacterium]